LGNTSYSADLILYNRVVDNLLSNAVKFTGDTDDRKIELVCRKKDKCVQICVKDNGIGIDPKYHEKIFETFNRLDPRSTEGTGVGLALVKKIVEGLGGRVWVESEQAKAQRKKDDSNSEWLSVMYLRHP